MGQREFILATWMVLGWVGAIGQTVPGQAPRFELWRFDEVRYTCRAKGRLQDKEYCESKMMDAIVAAGAPAIPGLIDELTDSRATKMPIYDYWNKTTAGDVAFAILTDLFTNGDWTKSTMPGLEKLAYPACLDAAEPCWRRFLRKHGRKFVQDQWRAAWEKNKDRIYWDAEERCFRVRGYEAK